MALRDIFCYEHNIRTHKSVNEFIIFIYRSNENHVEVDEIEKVETVLKK